MPALVTDQFRILNTTSFVDSVNDSSNSYYVFVGLANPTSSGYGRDSSWDTTTPNPVDNIDRLNHYESTMLFGKKITDANIRRVIRRIDWTSGLTYEMYRSDYSILNPSPITNSLRLYDADYYVVNSDYRVYICIDNGSSGISTNGTGSTVEPTFTDLEPTKLSDGYTWKYLYSISPSDIVKFDTTEYITVPNNWNTSTDSQISAVRENGDSNVNENQIKKVYIQNQGKGYSIGDGDTAKIVGDGTGGEVSLSVDGNGKITNATVISGGSGYTYGMINLGTDPNNLPSTNAELIPIIPPSKGHGFDIYEELGADKVLIYARFDDSTKDFPIDTKFAQIGIVKNPTVFDSTGINTTVYSTNEFSALHAMKVNVSSGSLSPGDKIQQTSASGGTTLAYVASYDILDEQGNTAVIKYYQDRSLFYNPSTYGHIDFTNIGNYYDTNGSILKFESTSENITKTGGGFSGTIDTGFGGITTTISNKVINLGVVFSSGLANPEINSKSGDVIYIDNRKTVERNSRQKEDVKIILEF